MLNMTNVHVTRFPTKNIRVLPTVVGAGNRDQHSFSNLPISFHRLPIKDDTTKYKFKHFYTASSELTLFSSFFQH